MILVLVLASAVYGAAADDVLVDVTVTDYITINDPGNVDLGTIAGAGGVVDNSATWIVSTNADNGYKLYIESSAAGDAMKKGADSFADYSGPAAWTLPANESAFGFSVNNLTNFKGLNGLTPVEIFSNTSPVLNESTVVNFRAAIGASKLQSPGAYQADLTVTAVQQL